MGSSPSGAERRGSGGWRDMPTASCGKPQLDVLPDGRLLVTSRAGLWRLSRRGLSGTARPGASPLP